MSRKDGRSIPYRSVLASKFLELVEAHPGVLRIEPKPKPLQWWNGSSWDLYRARYALICRAGSGTRQVEIEVLSDADLVKDEGRWKRIRLAYRQERRTFLTFTQHSVLVEPRLTNAMIINSHAGTGIVSKAAGDLWFFQGRLFDGDSVIIRKVRS